MQRSRLSLRELTGATRLAEPEFLTFHHPVIASQQSCIRKCMMPAVIHSLQSPGNTKYNRPRLTGRATAFNPDRNVHLPDFADNRQRNHYEIAVPRDNQILRQLPTVHDKLPCTFFDANPSHRSLATTSPHRDAESINLAPDRRSIIRIRNICRRSTAADRELWQLGRRHFQLNILIDCAC